MLRTAALELASVLTHLVRYPTGFGQPQPVAPAGATELPLVVLPGFADNTSIFTELRQALEARQVGPVVSFSYSPWVRDVRTAGARLAEQIETLCEISGSATVGVVGHSLGGLIARYYVQRLGGHVRAETVVTLATPHAGTLAAWLAPPLQLARQLRPGSELMIELAEPAPGCTTEFVAFSGDADQIVLPLRNARLEHPDLRALNVQVHGAGHLGIASHRQVIEEICALFEPVRAPAVPMSRTA
ncbi:alpha/beta fold hydrolase [Amycolatopsis acidicola]|uniref:Alpha/beta fold hydrolase n=1 Tax=Amycolatopsis acidicola TaxID=2596893 RepID=A0A5N0VF67_9PSEU|nr:alpha/beta fold hydrolase [Amycolatopsis acidicola]KAA9164956.1 alpha/beta fold hydrolase [Amycolatopsis acidicola]